jgi:glutathione S-transferase
LLPVLYSFRRCPYAIRARYTISFLGLHVYLREVDLKFKPQTLLSLGGRSSVPQLIDVEGSRYPESLDIIFWALSNVECRLDIECIWPKESVQKSKMMAWVRYNDNVFKGWLDRYKYADRYPECSQSYYHKKGEVFLKRLDKRLANRSFLFGEKVSVADIAIFPFIRQFAGVDQKRFDESQYHHLKLWLKGFLDSSLFKDVVMKKHSVWVSGQEEVIFPPNK